MSRLIPTVSPFYDPTTSTFSYVVADPTTSVAAIIDPVLDYNAITRDTATHSARKLLDFIVLRGLKVQWILETHAHADHLSSAQWLKEQLSGQPRVGIGAGIRQVQETFKARLSLEAGFPVDGSQFDVLFEDGDRVTLGSIPLEVIATPGHTPDSVTYLIGDAAFVGDTIFAPSYGTARCDFPGGNARTLYASMQRLLSLPAQTRIYLCHDYPRVGVAPQCLTDPLAQRQNVHLKDAVAAEDFVAMREARDATLSPPKLLEPSLRANVRAGHLSDPFFAARSSERAARAARLPQIDVSASYTKMADAPALSVVTPEFAFISPRIFDDDDFVMRNAQLSLPIFAGGSLSAAVKAAGAASEAAEADERRARADLKLAVAESYLGVLRSQRALRAAQASVAALDAHLQDVTAMVEVQARANTDLLASRVAASGAKQQLARARLGFATALGHYNRHLGEPLDRVVELEELPPAVLEVGDSALASLQDRAVTQRGELAGLAARADSLQAASRAEFGKMLPMVAVTASYQQLENTVLDREEFTMIGVGFRWAMFDGGQARHRASALRRSSDSVRQRRNELESIVRLEVQQAQLGIEAADARVALTRDAIAEASENLRITRELYAESLVTNTQVLEAIALQTAAEGHAADAVFDASLARLRLLKAIGDL